MAASRKTTHCNEITPTRRWAGTAAALYGVLLLASFAGLASAQSAPDLRTPAPSHAPRINGPKIFGARPGHPFLYRIPCTGLRPMRFRVRHLPATLHLDAGTGILSGVTPAAGRYTLTMEASNTAGNAQRAFTIVAGDTIGLTPQMGWNDWYSYYDRITQADVRGAAEALVSSGMADFGYQFVDIDDAWARRPKSTDPQLGGDTRDADGNIRPNGRFPDMVALTGYIHSLGLKAGIYTSPGPTTCAGFEGSYQHEAQDAQQFARWGFDLLKYDYCSYRHLTPDRSAAQMKKPYILMGGILEGLDRDVVFNLCEYGWGDVWKWGQQVGGNSWRTTDDLGVAKATSLPGFYHIAFSSEAHAEYARPGAWNDPDYILIGTVGDAHHFDAPAHATTLTADEQYSYMSMWSLMAAPLFFGGEMTHLDPLTLNVLCNGEVIDIDQDSLGRQARVLRHTGEELVLEKPLEDGAIAVGLFNLSEKPRSISADWKDLGVSGPKAVRDVWRQRALGVVRDSYATTIAPHSVMLVRLIAARKRSSE
jgi:alpha-galactosidase